jgi:hypothetical protein
MKNQKFLIALFLISCQLTFGQNARFSQIWSAPMQFNPSLTGRFDGKMRLSTLYSSQLSHNPDLVRMLHQNISLDGKFGKYKAAGDQEVPNFNIVDVVNSGKPVKEGKDEIVINNPKLHGYWGAGLNYYHYGYEKSPINATFFSLSLARHFYNGRNKFFGFGIQGTYASSNVDQTKGLAYDKEISGGGFRYPKGQPNNLTGNKSYVDFNGGAYYSMVTEPVMFEIGGAMYHLFYPKNDPFNKDNESKLRHRVTAHSMLRLKLNNNFGIIQRNIYWQEGMYLRSKNFKDSLEIVAFWSGMEFYKVNPGKKLNLNFGFYTRSFRTLMPYLNLNIGNTATLRYSYEQPINSAKYNAYNAKRSEISLMLSYKRNTKPGTRFYQKANFW